MSENLLYKYCISPKCQSKRQHDDRPWDLDGFRQYPIFTETHIEYGWCGLFNSKLYNPQKSYRTYCICFFILCNTPSINGFIKTRSYCFSPHYTTIPTYTNHMCPAQNGHFIPTNYFSQFNLLARILAGVSGRSWSLTTKGPHQSEKSWDCCVYFAVKATLPIHETQNRGIKWYTV